MNTLVIIKSRRAVREWESKEVSNEAINQILDAARFAPSPLNVQPWHFIVIKNKDTIKKIMGAAKHGTFAAEAPVIIVGTALNGNTADEWLYEHEPNIYNFSTVCAMENMWLSLADLQLAGCWVTLNKDVTKDILAIPDTHQIVGSLAIGYKKDSLSNKTAERHSIAEIMSFDSF